MRDDDYRHSPRRVTATAAIALSFLLVTAVLTVAFTQPVFALSISAPTVVMEGDAIAMTVHGTGVVTIARDGVLVTTGTGTTTDTFVTNSSSAGLITYVLADTTENQTKTVQVLDVPLSVNVTSPKTDWHSQQVNFSLITNWPADLCYVAVDGNSNTLVNSTPTTFGRVLTLQDGIHTVDYTCRLGDDAETVSKTFRVDSKPPNITSATPLGDVNGPYVTMTVDTDEIAQCHYDVQDVAFADMDSMMGVTFAARNTITLTADVAGPRTYFVRCQDVYNNAMSSSAIVSFNVKIPPYASISLDGDEPLKAGTYALHLETNAPLWQQPTLSYTFQESGKQQQVALSGEGTDWDGFVVIPEGQADTVISFKFQGRGRDGLVGDQIITGSLYEMDASPPSTIETISVENATGGITIRWFTQETADIARYNIYRAAHEGVDYTSFYTSTTAMEFTDLGAADARYYYYRVAPVDSAGNIGALSYEVFGSALDEQLAQPQEPSDPLLAAKLDEEIASMTAGLLDANMTLSQLEGEQNPVNVRIITDMQLVKVGRDAVDRLQARTDELGLLRARAPTAAEVDAAIANARAALQYARSVLVSRIVAQDQIDITQPSDRSAVERALPFALIGHELSDSERSNYLDETIQLQDKISISIQASSFTLYALSGGAQEHTFIRKVISLQEPRNDITVVEQIPKTISERVADIDFTEQPVVLEQDPVVSYSFPVLEHRDISYSVRKMVSMDDVKQTRTIAFPAVQESEGASDLITGQATRVSLPFVPSTDTLLIILGVLVVLGLGTYYMTMDDKRIANRPRTAMSRVVPAMGRIISRNARLPSGGLPSSRAPLASAVHAPASARNRTTQASSPSVAQTVARQSAAGAHVPQSRIISPGLMTSAQAQNLLEEAEGLVDKKEYDVAMWLYKDVLAHLGDDTDLQQILYEQTMRVYRKLLLFKRMAEAKEAAETRNLERLKPALREAQELAAIIGEQDTHLLREAKSSYEQFVRTLNALEIEHAAKY